MPDNQSRPLRRRRANWLNAGMNGRYLVIKDWGFGFWSDVSHVLGCLLLAEITDRTPVTDWGTGSRFRDASGRDAFTLYFAPVSNVFVQDLVVANDYFPPKWNGCNLPKARLNKWKGLWSRLDAETYLDRNEAVAVSDFYVSVAQMERQLTNYREKFRSEQTGNIQRSAAVNVSLAQVIGTTKVLAI